MKNKFFVAFIIACAIAIALIILIDLINPLAGTYGDLTYSTSNGEITITGYDKSATSVTIPSTIDDCPVTSIGDFAFYHCYQCNNSL